MGEVFNLGGRTRKPMRISIPDSNFSIAGSILIGGVEYITAFVDLTIDGRSINQGLHQATINLDASNMRFVNKDTGVSKISGGETVKIYFDYGAGSTLLFNGKAEYPSFSFSEAGYRMTLKANSIPEATDRKIRIRFDNVTNVSAIKNIIDIYLSSVASYTQFNATLGNEVNTITATYNDYIHRIIADIFNRAGWDGYFDFDPNGTGKHDLVGFKTGTVDNTAVQAAIGQNIISIGAWGKEFSREHNTIRVVGKTIGGSSILKTITNTASKALFWRKDKEVNDQRITTQAEANERATYEVAVAEQVSHGSFVMVGNKDMLPGKRINVMAQYCGGLHGMFPVISYSHKIGFQWVTSVDINSKTYRYIDSILERIKTEDGLATFDNPNDMENSINMDFDGETDSVNLVANRSATLSYATSRLYLNSGTTGTMVSINFMQTSDITQADLVLKNPIHFALSTIEISNDGGLTWVTFSAQDTAMTFVTANRQMKVRIVLNADNAFNTTPSLDGVTVRFK